MGLVVTGLVCAVAFTAASPSASTDISFHYVLADIIARNGGRHAPLLLMYMDSYPALAHWIAAIVARTSGSTMIGILSVGAFALGAIYFVILYLTARASMLAAGFAACILLATLSLQIDQSALHGFELVGNYFFGQVVALALCWIALLVLAPLLWEGPTARVTFVATTLVFVVAAAHLMPALQLAGAIGVLLLYRSLQTRQWFRLIGYCAIVGGMLLIHPSTRVMLLTSANNGSASLSESVALAVPFVALLNIVLASIIFRAGFSRFSGRMGGAEIVAAAAMSTGILCLLQAIALRSGYGSEYAITKYAHSVYTLAIVQIAIVVGQLAGARATTSSSFASAFAAVVVIVTVALILPRPLIPTAEFDELARYTRRSVALLGGGAEKQTVVLARSLHPAASFIVTSAIGNRKATGEYTLLAGQMPELETFRYAVVEAGDPLFPERCDVDVPSSAYRISLIECAGPTVNRLQPGEVMGFNSGAQGGYALRQGWSWVRGDGVWSTGSLSKVALTVPPTKNAALVIDAGALLEPRRLSLRASFTVAGKTVEQTYDTTAWRAMTALPIPDSEVDREIILEVRMLGVPDDLPYGIRLFSARLMPG